MTQPRLYWSQAQQDALEARPRLYWGQVAGNPEVVFEARPRLYWAQVIGSPVLSVPATPVGVTVAATGATTAAASLADTNAGAAAYRWQLQQVGGAGRWDDAVVAGGNPSAAGVIAVTLTGLPAAGEFLLRANAEFFGGLTFSDYAYSPSTFWTDNPGTGTAQIPGGGPATVAIAARLTHGLLASVQAAVSTPVSAVVTGRLTHGLLASVDVAVAFAVAPAGVTVAASIAHSLSAAMQVALSDPAQGATRAPLGRRLAIGSADERSGSLADRFYPFDLQDQLDFEWEFAFDSGDSDAVSDCAFIMPPGLRRVTSYVIGNRATCWVAADTAAPPAEFDLLPVTCRMVSASTPARQADATVYLQIRTR